MRRGPGFHHALFDLFITHENAVETAQVGHGDLTIGKAINPLNCVAQIEGGLAMGIGSALHEHLVLDNQGKVRNPSFLDYHLATSLDLPEMIPIIVECTEPEGPYGAKGLGEPGLAPTPAAIGNAVTNALRVRIHDLPLTPERVFWAIQKGKTKPA